MKTLLLGIAVVALGVVAAAAWRASESARGLVERANEAIDAGGGMEYLAEPAIDQLLDRLNESGYGLRPVDPSEPLLATRTILISEGMNERVARHVIERLLFLEKKDAAAPIDLRIATSGGWTDSAFAIVDTMRAIAPPVNVTAIGGCYSAGTVVLAGATGERAATPNALLSVHVNDYARPDDEYDADVRELERFRRIYLRHTGVPPEWFETPGDNQYYLSAEQALGLGLIDRIASPEQDVPRRDGKRGRRPAA
ncbi:MAG: ATP-dependent Clp protease proteolytic subunit [Planctomycetota bacterium]